VRSWVRARSRVRRSVVGRESEWEERKEEEEGTGTYHLLLVVL